jgi:hypothetical protein
MDETKNPDLVSRPTADAFLDDVRRLAEINGVSLEDVKFRMPSGMRCEWNCWTESSGCAF